MIWGTYKYNNIISGTCLKNNLKWRGGIGEVSQHINDRRLAMSRSWGEFIYECLLYYFLYFFTCLRFFIIKSKIMVQNDGFSENNMFSC